MNRRPGIKLQNFFITVRTSPDFFKINGQNHKHAHMEGTIFYKAMLLFIIVEP
jgi:hypothetical protein